MFIAVWQSPPSCTRIMSIILNWGMVTIVSWLIVTIIGVMTIEGKRKWFCLFDLPTILYEVDASGLDSFSTLMFLVPEIFCQTFLEPVQFYLRRFVKTFCTHFEFPINLQFHQNFMFCLPKSINNQWSYETCFYYYI